MTLFDEVNARVHEIPAGGNRAVEIVDYLLRDSLKRGASDLHIECKRDEVLVKMRLDGRLYIACRLESEIRGLILTRLKVMAKLVIYQHLTPQDGRIEITEAERTYSCRVAFLPTLHGEKVVIRLPESRQAEMELIDLGMGDKMLGAIERQLKRSFGTILLTGPSSSGKTTTIYAMLKAIYRLRGEAANIMTLEDPIEADLGIVSQTQVRADQGLTFEQGLRSILRQDPEVIMIGEIRDAVTAHIAMQAGLTGHLVISTIHSGRASGVFARLLHIGIEPFLIASAVSAVIAQRLVRRLCPKCKIERNTGQSAPLASPFDKIVKWCEPGGCPACEETGFRGRTGAFELLEMTERLRDMILTRQAESVIRELLHESGNTLERDLIAKVASGETAPEEALGWWE